MLELPRLLLAVPRVLRSRHDLLLENLFLRQQLQVAVRSQRRPPLRTWDKLIIAGERHLSTVLAEFVAYYNHDRPHRTLGLETPVTSARLFSGEVRSRPILGGLHHAYERAA